MNSAPAAALPRILIVDDEQGPPVAIRAYLANRAVCVFSHDPLQGLKMIETQRFDAAFIDINMPEMDGLTLITEIKRRDPYLACVVITGNASLDNAEKAVEIHAFRYMRKPLDMEKVRGTAEQAVDQTRSNREAFLSQLNVALIEKNLQRSVERMEAYRLQTKMFAGLLHDIGNPLMSLHGYATDLSDQLKSTPNTDASAVAGLLAQIEALQSITDLFHAAGKVVTPSKGSFKNTLTGASILLRQHAKRIDVRPVVVVGAAPENVMLRLPFGDALRILNNIGANALDSCAGIAGSGVTVVSAILPEGPSLNELRQHGFHLTRKGDSPSAIGPHAVIEFVDMGCGIAASRIPELFTSGYTSKPGGHGLGLTTTVALLDQYQGFAAVFSQEGKGTTFRVYLPCDTVPAELNRSPQVAS